MSNSIAVWLLASICLTWVATADGQAVKKTYRMGYLSSADPATDAPRYELLWAALRELGYVEGQNLTVERRYAEGKRERQAELSAELVRLNVEVILLAGGDSVTRAAMTATKTIPLVMTQGSDPVKAGFVQSLAHPGGNVTGITIIQTELDGKRLELFKEAIPKLARIAYIHDPGATGVTRYLKETIQVAASSLKLVVEPWEMRDAAGLEKDLSGISKLRVNGIYAQAAGGFMNANVKRITDFALKNRLPTMFNTIRHVTNGGLMSYSGDEEDRGRRIAYYIDRILKNAKPADLPVEQPMKFEFVINLKTAKQIGVVISPDVLARATRIIR